MTAASAPAPAEGDGVLPLPLSFPLTLRGYDRELVNEYVDELHAEIRVLTIDRDAAVRQAEALANRLEEVRAEHTHDSSVAVRPQRRERRECPCG